MYSGSFGFKDDVVEDKTSQLLANTKKFIETKGATRYAIESTDPILKIAKPIVKIDKKKIKEEKVEGKDQPMPKYIKEPMLREILINMNANPFDYNYPDRDFPDKLTRVWLLWYQFSEDFSDGANFAPLRLNIRKKPDLAFWNNYRFSLANQPSTTLFRFEGSIMIPWLRSDPVGTVNARSHLTMLPNPLLIALFKKGDGTFVDLQFALRDIAGNLCTFTRASFFFLYEKKDEYYK